MRRLEGIQAPQVPENIRNIIASIQQPMNDISKLIEQDQQAMREDAEFEENVHKIEL